MESLGMEPFIDIQRLRQSLQGVVKIREDGSLYLIVPRMFRGELVDRFVWTAAFGATDHLRETAGYIVRAAASALGIWCDSIHPLYAYVSSNRRKPFTVPAFNIRGMTFFIARMIFRSAMSVNAGPVIFELTPSEMEYTEQSPLEYSACILGAALRENYEGPVFIQGDHVKPRHRKGSDVTRPDSSLVDLIDRCIRAGFLNLDIDGSGLVDSSIQDLVRQQESNVSFTCALLKIIRDRQPAGNPISVGGEIGEIGSVLSSSDDLETFMTLFEADRKRHGINPGLSKVSIQTGTTHGGCVTPDGTIEPVELDFTHLGTLSSLSRSRFNLAGTVVHGASTLPKDLFPHFPPAGTIEIHLGTGIQNLILDHSHFPGGLREEIHAYLETHHAEERDESWTDEQFYYKMRKKVWGPFKRAIWSLDGRTRQLVLSDLLQEFRFFMESLSLENTRSLIDKFYPDPAPWILEQPEDFHL
jgi:fructose-bisphosphate aldolase, class II